MKQLENLHFNLAEALGEVSPWAFFTIGVVAVFVDLFLLDSFFLAWIGMAVASLGLLAWAGCSGDTLLFSFPVLLLFWTLVARPAMIRISRGRRNERKSAHSLVGSVGHVLTVNEEAPSQGRMRIPGQGEWSVRTEDGSPLIAGSEVGVIQREGLTLVVSTAGFE